MELMPFESQKNKVPFVEQKTIDECAGTSPKIFDEKLHQAYKLFLSLNDGVTVRKTDEYEKYFKPTNSRYPIQHWFKSREGFSIDLIKKIISENPSPRKVLDPFCGSGTTLVASTDLGIGSVGFDVNPLIVFAAKVKTRRYSNQDIDQLEILSLEVLQIASNSEKAPNPKDEHN